MANFSLINDSMCQSSMEVTQSTFFTSLLSLETIFGILGAILNLILAYLIFRALIYPVNLRILLCHLSLNIAWYSFGNSIKVSNMIRHKNDCGLVVSAYNCRLAELPLTIPSGNIVYSLITICVERVVCSIRYRTYDQESSKPYLAILFLSIIWTGSLAANLISFSSIPRNRFVPLCETLLSVEAAGAFKAFLSSVILEIIALIIIVCVSSYDKRKLYNTGVNRAKFTLSERFQIDQCVQVNAMLVPAVILHIVCFIPYAIIMLLMSLGISMDTILKWSLLHLIFVYRMIYAISYPLLAIWRNARLKEHVNKNLPRFLINLRKRWRHAKVNPMVTQSNTNAHFKMLEILWAMPIGKELKMNAYRERAD